LEDISGQSWVVLSVFVAVSGLMVWIFLRFEKTAKTSADEISKKMDEVEREYVRLKPEVDELKYEVSTKVDYDYLESKMHELVSLLADHAAKKEREPVAEPEPVAVAEPIQQNAN